MHRNNSCQLLLDPLVEIGVVVHGNYYLVRALGYRRGHSICKSLTSPQAMGGNHNGCLSRQVVGHDDSPTRLLSATGGSARMP